jgi:hypothetical protein
MSVHIHKAGINKTLGQQSDAIITSSLVGDFQPTAGINDEYWDNQVDGQNNLRRFNSISHSTTDPDHFSFDGTDDYLGVAAADYGGSPFNVNAANAFTLAQWVKYNNVNHYAFVIDDDSSESIVLDLNVTTNDKGSLTVASNANSVSDATTFSSFSFSDDTWYYIALTHDGSGNYKFYVNGSFIGSSAIGECTANQPLTIGKYSSNYTAAGTKVGHVHVYTAALTNSQVRQNFLATHVINNTRVYGATYTA